MTTLALLQDPTGKGGTATVVYWYRRWMQRHDAAYVELYLDEHGPGGWRRLRNWTGETSNIPRVLPRLHIPQYLLGARRLRQAGITGQGQVHVVGASIAHGALLPKQATLVWFATLFDDERLPAMARQTRSRRLLYATTLRPLGALEREVLGDAHRVLAMSHHTAELVIERGLAPPSAVEVLPVPVDSEVFRPPSDDEPRHGVLFVGRALDPRKGFERVVALVSASSLVRNRGVTVVTPGAAPPLPEGMRWMGLMKNLAAVYRAHEVLVLPSRQEGLGIVAFEALACGTPVVAWRCGGPDRFLEESGAGVVVESGAELRTAVERLLADPALRHEMGGAGVRYVERRFSASRFLDDPTLFRTR